MRGASTDTVDVPEAEASEQDVLEEETREEHAPGELPPPGDPEEQQARARRPRPPYTHPRQRSLNAGRIRPSRQGKRHRSDSSFWTLTQCLNEELWELGVELGFYPKWDFNPLRSKTGRERTSVLLKTDFAWWCKNCRAQQKVQDSLFEHGRKFWLQRIPLRKQLAALSCFSQDLSIDNTAEMVYMAATTVYKLYRHFVWVVAAEQKRLNDDLVVGGPGVEV